MKRGRGQGPGSCGWNRLRRDDGFSLLNTVLAISLGAMITGAGINGLISEQHISVRTTAVLEDLFQAGALARSMSRDVHAATHCMTDAAHQQLQVAEAGGAAYTYRLNGTGEIVRVSANGGTAVLASGVRAWHVTACDRWVAVTVTEQTGSQWCFDWTSLAGVVDASN